MSEKNLKIIWFISLLAILVITSILLGVHTIGIELSDTTRKILCTIDLILCIPILIYVSKKNK